MKAEELDEKFDNNEDVLEYFDLSSARRTGLETQPINIDFPQWMIDKLDREAKKLGIERQALIKVWIAKHLEKIV
jgi:hypothetical protein